jgi:hypothetical protein
MNEQKIEQFWRDAKHGDVARVMNREAVEARFRDRIDQEWKPGLLSGWSKIDKSDSLQWVSSEGASWRYCQVYEPQQWWLDKPDPGEGCRLLEKFPAEDLQPGDEWFEPDPLEKGWKVSHNERQANFLWYRRRIEPVKQDAGSTSASNIPKGWTALSDDEPRLESDAFWSVGAKDWVIIDECRVEYANRDKWPAIRQVENWRCMQLMEGCFYRLPNGQGIKVTKKGFELE